MPNLAKSNLLARKTRSAVTIFGIALSVMLLMVLAGLVNGTIHDIANRVLNIGADIMLNKDSYGLVYPNTTVNDKYADRAMEVEGVDKIAPVLIESTSSINGERQFNYVFGIDYDKYNSLGAGFRFVKGGRFEKRNDMIVDSQIAGINNLKIGDSIKMLDKQWRLSGIVKVALGANIFVDRMALHGLVNPGQDQGRATMFFIKAKEGAPVKELVARLEDEFGEDWSVKDVNELFAVFLNSALGLKEFMIALIGISAIICFSVILLSMYNSIIERTREIGILKSLGASKIFIVKELLREMFIVTFSGIILGFLMSYISMWVILSMFPLLDMELTLEWMGYSALIALCAALLGTLYPASRATRLDPVEALNWQ